MTPSDSDRLRSITHRVANVAHASDQDVQRVRRRLAFHRFLDRLADEGWVLKGGYCLEARLSGRARATKDLDVVRREALTTEDAVLDALDARLAGTREDGFTFEAVSARLLRSAEDPAPAWRARVECRVDGRPFETLTVDIVSQYDEVAGAVEPLTIPSPVALPGTGPVTVEAVDVHQHAAEKFHAMSRLYAGDRPSSRVKDLVDLALLLDAGLLEDHAALGARLRVVFAARDKADPPVLLPSPPAAWDVPFARMADDVGLAPLTAAEAYDRARTLYRSALSEGPR